MNAQTAEIGAAINKLLKQSSLQAPGIQKRIAERKAQTEQLEQEIDEILMEKLR